MRLPDAALIVFMACLGLNWPELPFGGRLAELLFLPLVVLAALELRGSRPSLDRLDLLVVAYLAGAVPSFFATDDPRASAIELMRHVYLAAVYVVVGILATSRARLVGAGLVAGAATLSGIGLLFAALYPFYPADVPAIGEVMNMPYVGAALRLRALTMSPSMLGSLLTASIPFAVAGLIAAGSRKERRRWAVAAALMCAAMVLTVSHTVSGFAVGVVIAAWPVLKSRPFARVAIVSAAVAIVLALNVTAMTSLRSVALGDRRLSDSTAYPYAMDLREASIGGLHLQFQIMSYLRTKQIALEAFLSDPVTGIGLDRFHQVTEEAYQKGRLTAGYRAIDPHSSIFGRMAETGLPGVLSLIALWIAFAQKGLRLIPGETRRAWLARAATAAFFGLLVNSINVDIMNFRFVWAQFGLLRGLAHQPEA